MFLHIIVLIVLQILFSIVVMIVMIGIGILPWRGKNAHG
jgi:hypothetical protein